MKFKVLHIILILALIAGCAPEETERSKKIPQRILPIEKMALIITDIQIAESVLREMRQTGQYSDRHTVEFMTGVFEKHGVSREKYEESLRYYEQNLDDYEKIFDRVIILLTQRQTELTNPAEK